MLAARDQENLAFSHQNGAAMKQQQGQVKRQLQPKTPGGRFVNTPLKVPLNDENAAHAAGGAKSVLGGRTKGNENALTSKGGKSVNKSSLATPSGPRSRAVLGDKTTNAKAKGQQTVTAKSAVREIEKSHLKAPTTTRPKQKHAQAEVHKLEVHAEETDPLSEEEIEYCPPRPKDAPYESDVFPNGALNLDALKRENLFKGYYDYYFNPVDEHGVPLADRELREKTRKALEEGDKRIQEDIENFEWNIQDELDTDKKKAKVSSNLNANTKRPAMTRAPSTIRSRNAADALSMSETTKSLERKAARPTIPNPATHRRAASFQIPGFRRQPSAQGQAIPRKTSMEIEANSRTTIGYTKGRSTASILAQGTVNTGRPRSTTGFTRTDSTLSNDSDKTITPARFAHKQVSAATEDQEWKERVPFLSIFNPEYEDDEEDFDLLTGSMPCTDEEEEFELKLID
ncbi:rRNA-processing protein fcf1 [Hypoxylon texense]